MDTQTTNIEDLLSRPLWQMTGEEFCALTLYAQEHNSRPKHVARQAIGMQQLAKELGCSASLLYGIRHYADFSPAVVSRIGRKEVFDIEIARKIASEYTERRRAERKSNS